MSENSVHSPPIHEPQVASNQNSDQNNAKTCTGVLHQDYAAEEGDDDIRLSKDPDGNYFGNDCDALFATSSRVATDATHYVLANCSVGDTCEVSGNIDLNVMNVKNWVEIASVQRLAGGAH